MIALQGVTKSFGGGDLAVRSLDLEVRKGELLALVGGSGSGKTTTLKMINRMIEPTSGRIFLNGQDISRQDPVQLRRGIGYVFQSIGLFPHMTVAQNVAVVPELLGWEPRDIQQRTSELLQLVGLSVQEHGARSPRQLSGGQQQRVGVARALAARPEVLLMDEPFGALDPLTRDQLQGEFLKLQRELGLTVVLVTHDMTEALLLADRIAVLQDGQLVGLGTPTELLTAPQSDYVRSIMAMPKRHADRLEELARPNGDRP